MPTTADDLLYDHCWELALRFALDRKFRGDVDPIAAAIQRAALETLEELQPNEAQREMFA